MFLSAVVLAAILVPSSAQSQSPTPAQPSSAGKANSAPQQGQQKQPPIEKTAKDIATALTASDDAQVRVASCDLLEEGARTDTVDKRCTAAGRKGEPTKSSVASLREQAKAGDADAIAELKRMSDELAKSNPTLAVEALAALPGEDGVDNLRELMASAEPEVRRSAAGALSVKKPEEGKKLIEQATKREAPSDVGFEAALGLAQNGDRDEIKRVSGWLPQLHGRDQFKAAGALASTGEIEGTNTLVTIAQKGDDDMLRLEAARALVKSRPDIASEAVEKGLASRNVWIRAEAASLASSLGPEWEERVRLLLADESSWVRLQAARGVLQR
jgi:hypothetical protein